MDVRIPLLLIVATVLAGCSHDDGYTRPAPTGYADLADSPIRGLSPNEIEELRSGAGMQLALPAELNGYPGPKHVLELADGLGLNASQRLAVQALYNETNQAARAAGERVLDAYEAVDDWFRSGAGSTAQLTALMEDLAEREAELRQVHLAAHLECKPLLTEHQLAVYQQLRGYGGDHATHH